MMIDTVARVSSGPNRQIALVLRPDSRAPQLARRVLREAVGSADMPHRLVDDAALVLGELVTQSICQARGVVELSVTIAPSGVIVRVADGARSEPVAPHAPLSVARSWRVVRRLSAACGCRYGPRGREMWAELRADPAVRAGRARGLAARYSA